MLEMLEFVGKLPEIFNSGEMACSAGAFFAYLYHPLLYESACITNVDWHVPPVCAVHFINSDFEAYNVM